MSQYILIKRLRVQNANAIAGFTWGFPAITHFLGFSHNLASKLKKHQSFQDICLSGCAVIAHEHKVHCYRSAGNFEFTQNRTPPYLHSHDKAATPPVIEEGKMNMTVSLLLGCEGNIGNRRNDLICWFENNIQLQRLAGGTILDIDADTVDICSIENEFELRFLKRKLLPGYLLKDRSEYLEEHFSRLKEDNPKAELLDAWLDFSALKQKARPKSDLIQLHLNRLEKNNPGDENCQQLLQLWLEHIQEPYEKSLIPEDLRNYFENIEESKSNKKLLAQWQDYCSPTDKTDADWEYIPKPNIGYLVPIMVGYKSISEVYKNEEVENTRDNETDVCFVESVHSVGEWMGVHKIKTLADLDESLWRYQYENNWYLCHQSKKTDQTLEVKDENPEDELK